MHAHERTSSTTKTTKSSLSPKRQQGRGLLGELSISSSVSETGRLYGMLSREDRPLVPCPLPCLWLVWLGLGDWVSITVRQ